MKPTPSLLRIIQVDYLASLGAIFPFVSWGLAVVGRFFDPEASSFFLQASPIVTVAGLVVIAWRGSTIRSVISNGAETAGVISGIGFFRGRGQVRYVYTYQGQKYEGSSAIQSTKSTRTLTQGQEVTVMVDPFRPRRAFVRELYL